MQSHNYTISELANEFDITTRTIRFYEDKGLLQPVREGQKRIYSSADRVRLILILRGRRLGFSIDESKDLIELYQPKKSNKTQLERYLQKIREKKEAVARQLEDIKILQKEINDAEKRCLNTIKHLN